MAEIEGAMGRQSQSSARSTWLSYTMLTAQRTEIDVLLLILTIVDFLQWLEFHSGYI